MLYNEILEVMEFADANVNYHHLNLLCDRMRMTQDLTPIFRSGLLNDDIGPIAKATFEVHTEVLLNASGHQLIICVVFHQVYYAVNMVIMVQVLLM